MYDAVKARVPQAIYYTDAEVIALRQRDVSRGKGTIIVVAAGTSDLRVAEEAARTAELMGNDIERVYHVGVAGLHRLLGEQARLSAARVIIVVAGMEGALPSVVAGLVSVPVVAVPTSVGYGASSVAWRRSSECLTVAHRASRWSTSTTASEQPPWLASSFICRDSGLSKTQTLRGSGASAQRLHVRYNTRISPPVRGGTFLRFHYAARSSAGSRIRSYCRGPSELCPYADGRRAAGTARPFERALQSC